MGSLQPEPDKGGRGERGCGSSGEGCGGERGLGGRRCGGGGQEARGGPGPGGWEEVGRWSWRGEGRALGEGIQTPRWARGSALGRRSRLEEKAKDSRYPLQGHTGIWGWGHNGWNTETHQEEPSPGSFPGPSDAINVPPNTLTPKSGPDAQPEVPSPCPSKPINRKCPRLG